MRNPKDTFVSCYMLTQYLKQLGPQATMESFLDEWLAGRGKSSPLCTFNY